MPEGSIRSITAEEGLELLALARVGRIAFVDGDGTLQLMPVNYVSDGALIYFRTQPGTSLGALTTPTDVAFEADFRDDLYQNGWNVTIHGRTLAPTAEQVEALESKPNPWVPGEHDLYVALSIDRVDGRRVRSTSS